MPKMYIAFILDLFQPSNQNTLTLDKVVHECYQPLVDLFNSKPNAKFTLSMSNSLAKQFIELGKSSITDGLRQAITDEKIEMIHTGAYHPLFPLIPEDEVKRQIELDYDFKKEYFNLDSKTGVFSPELGYQDSLLSLYKDLDFTWTVIDDTIMPNCGIEVPEHEILQVNGFSVLLRSSLWSNWIRDEGKEHLTGGEFIRRMEQEIKHKNQDCYKIIAISGETFGHHIKYYQETFLRDMLCTLTKTDLVELCHVKDLLNNRTFIKIEKVPEQSANYRYFPSCSWAIQYNDYLREDYFPHWRSQGNSIHQHLAELKELVYRICRQIDLSNRSNLDIREMLDQAFYSTQYFAASISFWNPEEIYQGIDMQMRLLYRCTMMTEDFWSMHQAETIYSRLMLNIYQQNEYLKSMRR